MKRWQTSALVTCCLGAICILARIGWGFAAYDYAWAKWDGRVESIKADGVGKLDFKKVDAVMAGYVAVPCKMYEFSGRRELISSSFKGEIDAEKCVTYTIWGQTFASFGRWHQGIDLYFNKENMLVGYVDFLE